MRLGSDRWTLVVCACACAASLLASSGCTSRPKAHPPAATPASGTPASGTAQTEPDEEPGSSPDEIRADGIGRYAIGASLADLRGRGLVVNVQNSPHCDDVSIADGTGRYTGLLTLTFVHDRLVAVHTSSATLRTAGGAKVGMALGDVKTLYADTAEAIGNGMGAKAVIVRDRAAGLTLLFFASAPSSPVGVISAGDLARLEDDFNRGAGC
jgi:hypothetical protein